MHVKSEGHKCGPLRSYTGWAISPCTTSSSGGGRRSETRPEALDNSNAYLRYREFIHIDIWEVALVVRMQQALRQIMQIKHRAETAISAILTRRRVDQETCIKVQSLVFCGIGLLILIVCGRSEHRHRLPPLKPLPPKNKSSPLHFKISCAGKQSLAQV
jgi:hypothetical protein